MVPRSPAPLMFVLPPVVTEEEREGKEEREGDSRKVESRGGSRVSQR